MNLDQLAPCPFCGGARAFPIPANRKSTERLYPIVRCMGCFTDVPGKTDDFSIDCRTAVAAWNRRASLPSTPAVTEAMRSLEELANMPLGISLEDWSRLSSPILAALSSRVEAQAGPVAEKYPLATFGHPDVLPLGLYRVHWASGGSSLAAVGMMKNGDRWIAPTNWTSPCLDPTNEWAWGGIDRVEPIPAPADAVEPVAIKALEWEEIYQRRSDEDPNTEVVGFEASTGFDAWYHIEVGTSDFVLHRVDTERTSTIHETERAAKAAAQADYEQRIRSALAHPSPSPVSAPGVMVAVERLRVNEPHRPAFQEAWNGALDAVLAALRSPAVVEGETTPMSPVAAHVDRQLTSNGLKSLVDPAAPSAGAQGGKGE